MPPKKKSKAAPKAAAATPAGASTRSEGPAVPATVTSKRGKEFDTTAALSRPRRATATVAPTEKAPAKSPAKKVTKAATKAPAETAAKEKDSLVATKKRGRPAKAAAETATANDEEPAAKRSRTAKGVVVTEPAAPKRKPGRPAKAKKADTEPEEAPDAPDNPAPRKRHSGPRGGETTKISTDDADAQEQLEDELMDEAEETAATPGQKRMAPAPKASKKGKGKAAASTDVGADDADELAGEGAHGDADEGGKNYWLMKAEQIDRFVDLKNGGTFNTKFTIDDLKAADAPEPWDGVRNLVARNNIRKMKQGDLAFFYASQGKGKLQPGITGIMEVVREHEPDQTVDDENSHGYVDPKDRKTDWSLVHVEFRKKLKQPVTLKELQKFGSSGNGVLGNMECLKQTRLSVTRVSEKEWNFIVNKIVDGYEEEDVGKDGNAGSAVKRAEAVEPAAEKTDVVAAAPGDAELPTTVPATAATKSSRAGSRAASRQASLAPPPTFLTTEMMGATATATAPVEVAHDSAAPTSRPASVKPAPRAGSKKPVSRAGSLAPTRPASRGRSRTPKPLAPGAATGAHMTSVAEEEATTAE